MMQPPPPEDAHSLVSSACADTFSRCRQGLAPLGCTRQLSDFDSLTAALARARPKLIVLDLALPGLSSPRDVATLCASIPAARIIALAGSISEDTELGLYLAGVRGCCPSDAGPPEMMRAALAVLGGEFWIRRKLAAHVLGHVMPQLRDVALPPPASGPHLAGLTSREREIAILISSGRSNKQIARELDVTESTVKAHLTRTFRKLGISGRLTLALRVNGGAKGPTSPDAGAVRPIEFRSRFRQQAV